MVSLSAKFLLMAAITASLYNETYTMPLLLKAMCEPAFLFIRYRAAALYIEAGLGVGAKLTKFGREVNKQLTNFGHSLLDLLNNIAKMFTTDDQLRDDQLEPYKLLMYYKEQYIRDGDFNAFTKKKRSIPSEPTLRRVRKGLTRIITSMFA